MSESNPHRIGPGGPRIAARARNIIYALADPRSGEVRYIGQSSCGMRRPREHFTPFHMKAKRQLHSTRWIGEVMADGFLPEISILAECESRIELDTGELFYIALHTALGCRLTNHTIGGRSGTKGYAHTAATRAKLSEARRRYLSTPDGIAQSEKMGLRMLGKKYALGYKHTATALAAISAATKRVNAERGPMSDATKAKIRAALIGKPRGKR